MHDSNTVQIFKPPSITIGAIKHINIFKTAYTYMSYMCEDDTLLIKLLNDNEFKVYQTMITNIEKSSTNRVRKLLNIIAFDYILKNIIL